MAVEPGKSPAITLERVRQAESKDGPIAAGDVVIFRSGYSDRFAQSSCRCSNDGSAVGRQGRRVGRRRSWR